MIIGVSGRIDSGKDTVGKIIQYLVFRKCNDNPNMPDISVEHFELYLNSLAPERSSWDIVKFADKLKDCVCIILGCTREDLEDNDFKNTPLGDEWIRYGYANGFTRTDTGKTIMNNEPCSKERYEEEVRTNWQTAYKTEHTPRTILQILGTQVGRFIHTDIWVNATIRDYKQEVIGQDIDPVIGKYDIYSSYPDWVITDVRFENEAKAIKDKNGILIRLRRNEDVKSDHISETALDDYDSFDHIIDNRDGNMLSLIASVKSILEIHKII